MNIALKLKKNLEAYSGIIVTVPEAAIYFILDFKNIINKDLIHQNLLLLPSNGKEIKGKFYTEALAPMDGFYTKQNLERHR